ncbi:MAG: tRNA (adenosine(37)-N6)-dimethylallyltransferase MiaA [Woeseiaceae bacterium]|nr:tRNA (adenosine(37)-N6)-dimethylallyltransferase MiaA [Woeseiaceae bacterium]
MPPPVICLMGPTASGKTTIALRLADRLPVDLVSVDSALVYRGMNIGTAKPDAGTLARYPHRLIDIREPEAAYSAGAFVRDALVAIRDSHDNDRVPLLVGGTMLYFRALTRGMAELPTADATVRRELDAAAARRGWPDLHRDLAAVDPAAARRISPNDSQRIQRALEVYRLSGRPLSDWQHATAPAANLEFLRIGLLPAARADLHARIATRLDAMLDNGFVDEVRALRRRPGLTAASPSMRAVGYRQLWAYLAGDCDLETARERALAATRQLAKRQITWLRTEPALNRVDPLEAGSFDTIWSLIRGACGE